MSKNRLPALLLALALLAGLLGGCGSQSSTASTTASAETAAAESADVSAEATTEASTETSAETTLAGGVLTDALDGIADVSLPIADGSNTYTIWMAAPGTISSISDLAQENETWKELQTRTGVNVTFEIVDFFSQETQFGLITASGDFPDVMNGVVGLYTGGADAAIDDGAFLNLADYIDEYAPHYSALIHADSSVWDDVSTPNDNLAAFYSLYDDSKYGLGDKGYQIREDWLDKLGLDMPKTYDELHDVLTAFKDKEGATDALALPDSGLTDTLIGGYGVGSTFYVQDGTIKFGPLESGFEDYLKMLNQWYSEGLIYKDFYSYANELMFDDTADIAAGKVALYYNETGTMVSYGQNSTDPDFKMKAMAPVVKSEGDTAYMTDFAPTYVDSARWSISASCKEPEKIIQMVDYLFSDDGILLCNYGIEGLTFNYDDSGKPVFTDLILNNPDGLAYRDAVSYHVIDSAPTVYDPLRGASNYTENQLSSWDDWTDQNLDYSYKIPTKAALNTEEATEKSSIYSDIDTFLDSAIVKYIIGDASFDTYDQDFVAQIQGMNIDRCIELYQEAYDRYKAS